MSVADRLVVDASVAVKWYVPEPGSAEAVALLGERARLLAPDLLTAELGNTLWKKTRRGELRIREAQDIVKAFVVTPPVTLRPSAGLLGGAFDIAVRFQRTVYDALYLALAVSEGCALVTADQTLVRAMHGTALQGIVTSIL